MTQKAKPLILSCEAVYAMGPRSVFDTHCLVEAGEFLKLVEAVSGHSITRHRLQYYSSPNARLMPLPTYAKRHTAHYEHPEQTLRLALLLQLRDKYYFPIKLLRTILDNLQRKFYGAVLQDALTPQQIKALALGNQNSVSPRALAFEGAARLLMTAQDPERISPAATPSRAQVSAALKPFRDWLDSRPERGADAEERGQEWLTEPGEHFGGWPIPDPSPMPAATAKPESLEPAEVELMTAAGGANGTH